MDFICQVGLKHKIHFMWRPALRDPDDDMVLELAVAAGSGIVTFNERDFKEAPRFGVRIWAPGGFLKSLR